MNKTHHIHFFGPLVLAMGCLATAAAGAQVAVVVEPVVVAVDPATSLRQQEMTLQLARANLGQQGISEPTIGQLALATSDVQTLRDSGLGWGQIANSLGLRLGAVVSAANRSDRADRLAGLAIGPRAISPTAKGLGAGVGGGKATGGSSNGGGQGASNSGNKGSGASAGGNAGGRSSGGGNAGGNGGGKR